MQKHQILQHSVKKLIINDTLSIASVNNIIVYKENL